MTSQRFSHFFVACVLAFGLTSVPAAHAAVVATGTIVNS